jgi:hypothetical protein
LDALPNNPAFYAVSGAGHFDFLVPCAAPATMPQLCASAPGFDRAAFYARFDAEVVRFFTEKLSGRSQRQCPIPALKPVRERRRLPETWFFWQHRIRPDRRC